jgi:hypothetical protein
MKTTLSLLSLLALFAFAVPQTGHADDKPAKTEAKEKKKSQYTPLYAQVESITDTELVTKGETNTKFVINAETKISKDKAGKEPAKASDVKVGQWVGGSYTKGADGTNTLHSLHLDVDQSGPKKKKKDAK